LSYFIWTRVIVDQSIEILNQMHDRKTH
jgi:hypothetical protein